MQGSLCLSKGVLYVGRHARTAEVRPYDLDGRALGGGFRFSAVQAGCEARGYAAAAGLAMDDDHRLWVADTAAGAVRSFSVFGAEFDALGGGDPSLDRPGRLGPVIDLCVDGTDDASELTVASAGERRHALQILRTDGRLLSSLRPEGDPLGRFKGLRGVARSGRMIYACEQRAGRVQVFRDGEHHFSMRPPANGGARFEPTAAAPLQDGRVVIACGGSSSGLLLLGAAGQLRTQLAQHGTAEGAVFQPNDVVLEEGHDERHTRLAVIDCDGDRVQVFNLEGLCYGSFTDLPRA